MPNELPKEIYCIKGERGDFVSLILMSSSDRFVYMTLDQKMFLRFDTAEKAQKTIDMLVTVGGTDGKLTVAKFILRDTNGRPGASEESTGKIQG